MAVEHIRAVFGRLQAVLQRRQEALEAELQAAARRKRRALEAQDARLREEAVAVEGTAQRLRELVEGMQAAGALGLAADLQRKQGEAGAGMGLVEQRGLEVGWKGGQAGQGQAACRMHGGSPCSSCSSSGSSP